MNRTIEILLIEDSPSDIRLTQEVLQYSRITNTLHVVEDGEEALDFLHQRHTYAQSPRPDLILLDLNLPNIDGREILREIKQTPALQTIPVVILTTSNAPDDVRAAYADYANCYITKPLDFAQFVQVIKSIENFWLTLVRLPRT